MLFLNLEIFLFYIIKIQTTKLFELKFDKPTN